MPDKSVFLTFDDGPNEPCTSDILNILSEFGAKATFFVCGRNLRSWPEAGNRIVSDGHLIGNHTYSHSRARAFVGLYGRELEETSRVIETVTGQAPRFFRPPWGLLFPWLRYSVTRRGYTPVRWNLDSRDWTGSPADNITRRVLSRAKQGSVILFHDGSGTRRSADRSQTVLALPDILKSLGSSGYIFETLDKLASCWSPPPPTQPPR